MNLVALQFLALFILVLMSALFSATEVAYTGLNQHQLKRINRLYPDALTLWERKPSRVLATLLLSNNGVNTAVGVLAATMAQDFSQVLHWNKSVLTLVFGFIAGSVVLLFGEIIPKIWAQQFTISWALGVTPFMEVWCRLVGPIAKAATRLTHFLLLGRARQRGGSPFLHKSELRRILVHSRLPSVSRRLLDNVMDFGRLVVSDVSTDKSEMFAISLQLPMEKVVQNVIKSGWSRVPIYDGTVDNVVGLLYSKDLLVAWRSQTLVVLEDLLRPILTVSPDTPLPDLLRLFRTKHQHMAVVRDLKRDGSVTGLVTLQDALEAIVGRIKEEI